MLQETTETFLKTLDVPSTANPLRDAMLLLAIAIDEATNPSASLFSEYMKVHARLLQMTTTEEADPVEKLLNSRATAQ